jgi:hypothetical protein
MVHGATGVEESRTKLKEHLPKCDIFIDVDDFYDIKMRYLYEKGDEGEDNHDEEEDGLDEDGDEDVLDGDEDE